MTKEQFEVLEKYKDRLTTAYKSNYCRNLFSYQLDEIHKTYLDITNIDYHLNRNCSTCILNFLKTVGKLYFEELDKINLESKDSANNDKDGNEDNKTENTGIENNDKPKRTNKARADRQKSGKV